MQVRGIPHLAKNERDMGQPLSALWTKSHRCASYGTVDAVDMSPKA
jgi:hypothetical protein